MKESGSNSTRRRTSNVNDHASGSLKVLQLHSPQEELRALLLLADDFGFSDLKSRFIIFSCFYLIFVCVNNLMQTSQVAECNIDFGLI